MDNQLILYRLFPDRGSRGAIDTHFEMGILCGTELYERITGPGAVRDSQC